MKSKQATLAMLFSMVCLVVQAQPSMPESRDSLNSALLSAYKNYVVQSERARIQDSMQREALTLRLTQPGVAQSPVAGELRQQIDDLYRIEEQMLAARKGKMDSLRALAHPFPVLGFHGDTLFSLYNKLGSLTAQDRARAIAERISRLRNDFAFSGVTLNVTEDENTSDIVQGDWVIMSVSANDALWHNTTKQELAARYLDIISKEIGTYRAETNTLTLARNAGLALLVLAGLILMIFLSGRLFKWSSGQIARQEGKRVKEFRIRDYTLMSSGRLVGFLQQLNNLVKWLVYALLIYIALPILFGLFPWTKNFAGTLFGFILNPLKGMLSGIWNYLPNLFTILVVFFVFHLAIRALRFLKAEIERGELQLAGFYPDWANPTFQILRVLLYAFMFVLIFPYLPGSDSPIFKGVSVFLGFLFTFGSAGSLSNIMAGIVLTYMRLFKIGDRVKIGDVTGDVIEKSLLVTRVKTVKNEIVSIPNSTVMSSHTVNYSNEAENGSGLILHTTVTIGYDVPWKDMHQALLNAADRTGLLLKDPKPFVLQTSLDDFYVSYQINAYTRETNRQAAIYSELHQNIQDCCNEAGIEILSPHYRAARDGNMTTIPSSYLGKEYKAPGFVVTVQREEG